MCVCVFASAFNYRVNAGFCYTIYMFSSVEYIYTLILRFQAFESHFLYNAVLTYNERFLLLNILQLLENFMMKGDLNCILRNSIIERIFSIVLYENEFVESIYLNVTLESIHMNKRNRLTLSRARKALKY